MESLVILNGWNGKKTYFNKLEKALKKQYKIHYINFNEECSKEEFKNKVINYIKKEKLQNINILAWSMGATIFFEVYKEIEEKIKAIIFIGAFVKFTKGAGQDFGWNERVVRRMIKKIKKDTNKVIVDFTNRMLSENEREYEGIIVNEHKNIESLVYGLEYLIESDFREKVQAIKQPVLILQGESDEIVEKGHSKFLHHNIKRSSVCFIKECGHMPFYTKAELIAKEIELFLRGSSKSEG